MDVGGVQRVALNLCTGLVEKGHDIEVVLVNAEGELLNELPEEVSVIDLGEDRVATTVFPLRRYLNRKNPDVLYAMMTEINIIATIAHRLSRVDSRLILSEHNMPTNSIDSKKDLAVMKLATLTYSLADHAVAVSNGVYEDLLNVSRLSESKISQVHNPININRIRTDASEQVSHRWLNNDDYNVVISAGRHVPQKGFDTLIESFSRVKDENLRLLILGKGDETESLKEIATNLGIKDRVEFPGFVENPFAYISRADVFVLSSQYEGFGMVLVEALACGCAVVSTNCPSGPEEILKGGEYGPLVPVGAVDELTSGIERVLDSPPTSDELESRARDFAVNKIASEYEDVFFNTM